ncbi:MAG: asparagine synthetase B, partial [Clostridia bacterium]|nr:asparagine synthetase B [Clostridia bacterium]
MCSIIGYCGPCDDREAVLEGFAQTKTRGPDDTRVIDTGKGLLGFHRLAIMDLTDAGMQPFERNGSYAVCNGEIYDFDVLKEELADSYTFTSVSDCEVLLPLWRKYGVDMFPRLDAEFACVLYDGETGDYIAARDPIGIRPLYYGVDKAGTTLFASEAKNLVGLCRHIKPFPPGCYWYRGQFVRYCDICEVKEVVKDDLETV